MKPQLQVGFSVMSALERNPSAPDTLKHCGHQLLTINVTNMGPGPVLLYMCAVKLKRDWRKFWKRGGDGFLNPIHDNPMSKSPTSLGPFSAGLPVKIDAGEMKAFYFPYGKDCFLKDQRLRGAGISDTFNRVTLCRRKDMRRVMSYRRKDQQQA